MHPSLFRSWTGIFLLSWAEQEAIVYQGGYVGGDYGGSTNEFQRYNKTFLPDWYDGFYWDSLYVWLARLIHYCFGFCIIKLVILSLSPFFSLFTSRILRFLLIASFCIMKLLARYDAESKFARYLRGREVLICLVICHAVLIKFVPIHSSIITLDYAKI